MDSIAFSATPSPGDTRHRSVGIALVAGLLPTLLMVLFHDRSWFAPDEGIYAHIAERVLQGEILHRDIQDIHPGYIHYLNALSLQLFGHSLESLRITLAAGSILAALMVAILLNRSGVLVAVIGSVATVALGPLVFLNPSANWYALFLAIGVALVIQRMETGSWGQLLVLGLLIGATFMVRQLSAVFLALGALAAICTFCESNPTLRPFGNKDRIGAIFLGGGCALAISGYFLIIRDDLLAWVLFGLGPTVIAILLVQKGRTKFRLSPHFGYLAVGLLVPAFPVFLQQLLVGDLEKWIFDITRLAASITRIEFVENAGYDVILSDALFGIFLGINEFNMGGIMASVAILGLLLAPALLAIRVVYSIRAGRQDSSIRVALVALFYAVGNAHYPSLIYLAFAAPLVVAAHLYLASGKSSSRWSTIVVALISACSVVGLAARQMDVSAGAIIRAQSISWSQSERLPSLGLRIPLNDVARYDSIIESIWNLTHNKDKIFVFPANPEIYFLSKRSNPFSFYNSTLGIQTCIQLERVATHLAAADGPALVVHGPHVKYETDVSLALKKWLDNEFQVEEEHYGFKVYTRPRRTVSSRPVCPEPEVP